MTPELLAAAERDTVELTDHEHLREYARQLERCVCELGEVDFRLEDGREVLWLIDVPTAMEENRLGDMIYSMTKEGA